MPLKVPTHVDLHHGNVVAVQVHKCECGDDIKHTSK